MPLCFEPEKLEAFRKVEQELISRGAKKRNVNLLVTHMGFRESDAALVILHIMKFSGTYVLRIFREIIKEINKMKIDTFDLEAMGEFSNSSFEEVFPQTSIVLDKFKKTIC